VRLLASLAFQQMGGTAVRNPIACRLRSFCGCRAIPQCWTADGVRLLHFHIGSQIANLADDQHGFREAIRYFGECARLGLPVASHRRGRAALGVDYDGTLSLT